ncbi:GTPase SAR1 family protein [Chryseobacterium sp. PvR013]|uniref:AAA family ATPase n=1 Tax=Chryseobacterium sp. PvR013 TaxID=2806595 RepID=UPI001AE4E937|nr:AAA family ATPase [Chryseobacterium sp. PvR013]MBP1163160.1 GTPase SAR1 family protein [Chryseobacterium sp. PvR013]
MRIAIFGAHKVGKTTLAEELLENLPGYTLETEPYYQMESSGFEFSEEPNAEDFVEQFNYSVQLISQSSNDVLFDRCFIDILAYLHILDPHRNIKPLFEKTQAMISEIFHDKLGPIKKIRAEIIYSDRVLISNYLNSFQNRL